MKHIITHFFEKHNPKIFLLRFGLTYAGGLAMLAVLLLSRDVAFFSSHYQQVELVLVAAITAFLQTLIGYGFLSLCIKKDRY